MRTGEPQLRDFRPTSARAPLVGTHPRARAKPSGCSCSAQALMLTLRGAAPCAAASPSVGDAVPVLSSPLPLASLRVPAETFDEGIRAAGTGTGYCATAIGTGYCVTGGMCTVWLLRLGAGGSS